jgi:hypothetical protein
MFNIPVSQTQFEVTHPPWFCDIQNWSRNLSKLKYPRNLQIWASFEYTPQTQNSTGFRIRLRLGDQFESGKAQG